MAEPFHRLMQENRLLGYQYDKFWYCMDTFKEQQELNDMFERGNAPWEVWKNGNSSSGRQPDRNGQVTKRMGLLDHVGAGNLGDDATRLQ